MEVQPLLAARQLTKSFGGVHALRGVDFALMPREIHALVGENGAGKSTLIKIFTGLFTADTGEMLLEGRAVRFARPADALAHGIATVFQELSLLNDFTVAENVFAAREPRGLAGLLNPGVMQRETRVLLQRYDLQGIEPDMLVRELSLAQRQQVEIIKALARAPRILILDEATSALPEAEVEQLFTLLRALRDGGTSIIYISHRLQEVMALADRATVFRDGMHVTTVRPQDVAVDEIITAMIGRQLTELFPPRTAAPSTEELLSVQGLARGHVLHDVTLHVAHGEILGIGGLAGQGQGELLLALSGVRPATAGEIRLDGRHIHLHTPRDAIRHGIAYIPEDRKGLGVALPLSIQENIALPTLRQRLRIGLLDTRAEEQAVKTVVRRLAIRTPSITQPVAALSGGNQQKVVLAKWLLANVRILLLNDPTRGIDVGAKREIFSLMRELTAAGLGIIFVTSDLTELVGMSDRVAVMYEGTIITTFATGEISADRIVAAAVGVPASSNRENSALPDVQTDVPVSAGGRD